MQAISKIISGGQTGADQAALAVATALKIDCGGWCPPGRACETGKIPDHLPLTETPYQMSADAPGIPRSLRTEWNVRDADATLILTPDDIASDKGTEWTIACIKKYKKASIVVNPFDEDASEKIKNWLDSKPIVVLNVAGPAESSCNGIGDKVYRVLFRALSR